MAKDTQKTATLTLDGKTLELPVYDGSMGPSVIDVRTLYKELDVFTSCPPR